MQSLFLLGLVTLALAGFSTAASDPRVRIALVSSQVCTQFCALSSKANGLFNRLLTSEQRVPPVIAPADTPLRVRIVLHVLRYVLVAWGAMIQHCAGD